MSFNASSDPALIDAWRRKALEEALSPFSFATMIVDPGAKEARDAVLETYDSLPMERRAEFYRELMGEAP